MQWNSLHRTDSAAERTRSAHRRSHRSRKSDKPLRTWRRALGPASMPGVQGGWTCASTPSKALSFTSVGTGPTKKPYSNRSSIEHEKPTFSGRRCSPRAIFHGCLRPGEYRQPCLSDGPEHWADLRPGVLGRGGLQGDPVASPQVGIEVPRRLDALTTPLMAQAIGIRRLASLSESCSSSTGLISGCTVPLPQVSINAQAAKDFALAS
jgi:hypothetical protein